MVINMFEIFCNGNLNVFSSKDAGAKVGYEQFQHG